MSKSVNSGTKVQQKIELYKIFANKFAYFQNFYYLCTKFEITLKKILL